MGAGEGWRQLMNDCKLKEPYCTSNPPDGSPSDCGFQVHLNMDYIHFKCQAADCRCRQNRQQA